VNERGYSLVELLVSVAILLAILGSVCQLASPAHASALAQAELQDMQQRARVLADRLTFDLRLAGAKPAIGSSSAEVPFAAVLPAACCGAAPDPPGSERSDRLTVIFVSRGSPAPRTAAEIASDALRLDLAPGPACVMTAAVCGFGDGEEVVVFDGTGRYDVFRLDLSSGIPMLEALTAPLVSRYAAGATVARVTIRTYSWDASSGQVFVVDGGGAAEPLLDRVANLRFEYSDGSGAPLDGQLGDGPWIGAGGAMYDGDVSKIRRVRVSYSIRSGLHGTGVLDLPDLATSFDVALRNAGGGS
jgi:prepilin-type N-terminal cleavage/methylation domain-containing protein